MYLAVSGEEGVGHRVIVPILVILLSQTARWSQRCGEHPLEYVYEQVVCCGAEGIGGRMATLEMRYKVTHLQQVVPPTTASAPLI